NEAPSSIRRGNECRDRLVVPAQQTRRPNERALVLVYPCRHRFGPAEMDLTREEAQDRPTVLVESDRLRRRIESRAPKVREERMHRGGPRPGASVDDVADAHRIAPVAAEGMLLHSFPAPSP